MPDARTPRRFRPRVQTAATALLAASGTAALVWAASVEGLPEAADFDTRASSSPSPVPAADRTPPAPPARTDTTSDPAAAPGSTAAPIRLDVERVGLSAAIEPVGVAVDGTAEIPRDPGRVGWYRFGPAPGEPSGSAVLVGHVDSRTGDLGAFAALFDVRAGDEVSVRRAAGPSVAYRVVARARVDKDRLPASAFARTGRPTLTLITCAPPFDRDRGGYRRNLIVTAVPAGAV
ncbi:class F sortase [Streptomyces sp. NPDC006458]|uniref:class F sortase n=1 Tax=Streptomyces sp. NPDC006458 TaxID=3154302 RepID=UPI0033B1CB9E